MHQLLRDECDAEVYVDVTWYRRVDILNKLQVKLLLVGFTLNPIVTAVVVTERQIKVAGRESLCLHVVACLPFGLGKRASQEGSIMLDTRVVVIRNLSHQLTSGLWGITEYERRRGVQVLVRVHTRRAHRGSHRSDWLGLSDLCHKRGGGFGCGRGQIVKRIIGLALGHWNLHQTL